MNVRARGSKQKFRDYRAEREAAHIDPKGAKGGKSRQRSLRGLYRELYRLLEGHRGAVALALLTLSVTTTLKLVPPAATKLVIDHVLLGHPLPPGLPAWLPIPGSARHRLYALVGIVFAISVIGTVVGLWGRWLATLASKQLQIATRRKVFEHAARLPLHRVFELKAGGASSLLREDAGGVGELIFSMLYNPWRALVQLAGGLVVLAWVDWRLLGGAVVLLPGAFLSDRLWNRRLRPLYRDVRKLRQEIDARSAEAFGGMRVVRAFGRQRRETPGSSARTT